VPIIFFPEFYKYGKNTGLSRLKTGSRKYGRDTPPPASRPISVFFRKYGNGRDKYRNTNRTGRDFFRPFSSLYRGDIYFFYLNFEVSGSLKMRPVVGGL